MNKKWSIEEENYIKQHAGLLSDEQIAENLTKISRREITKIAVRRKRNRLQIKKKCGRGKNEIEEDTFKKGLREFERGL